LEAHVAVHSLPNVTLAQVLAQPLLLADAKVGAALQRRTARQHGTAAGQTQINKVRLK
jgi:hypothetical protein